MTYKWGILGIYWGFSLLTNPAPMSSTSPRPVVGTNELLRIWMPLHGVFRAEKIPAAFFLLMFSIFHKETLTSAATQLSQSDSQSNIWDRTFDHQVLFGYLDEATIFFTGQNSESTSSKSGPTIFSEHREKTCWFLDVSYGESEPMRSRECKWNTPHSPPEKLLETSGTHLTSCSFKYHYKGAPLFFSFRKFICGAEVWNIFWTELAGSTRELIWGPYSKMTGIKKTSSELASQFSERYI